MHVSSGRWLPKEPPRRELCLLVLGPSSATVAPYPATVPTQQRPLIFSGMRKSSPQQHSAPTLHSRILYLKNEHVNLIYRITEVCASRNGLTNINYGTLYVSQLYYL